MTKQAREALRRLFFLVPVSAAIFCFILDANTQNGLLDGLFYVSAVLLCQWVPDAKSPLYLAAGLTPAMWLGFALSETASPLWMAVTNRSIAIFAVWVAALVVSRNTRAAERITSLLNETAHRLQLSSRDALGDRSGIADWLKEEIVVELELLDRRLHRLQHASWYALDLETEATMLRRWTVAKLRVETPIHAQFHAFDEIQIDDLPSIGPEEAIRIETLLQCCQCAP